ncbi:MAG: hypothetical protein V7785_12340 [Bermanella sp.]
MKYFVECKILVVLFLMFALAGCAEQFVKDNSITTDSSLAIIPSWYHQNVGFQLMGANQYSGSGALVHLLQDADLAFTQLELQKCQIFLERAQRIASRDSSVYVRLSYLFWVQGKPPQAEQMARRALAVMPSDGEGKKEIQRLLAAIQNNQY